MKYITIEYDEYLKMIEDLKSMQNMISKFNRYKINFENLTNGYTQSLIEEKHKIEIINDDLYDFLLENLKNYEVYEMIDKIVVKRSIYGKL